jgi:hypothetical protein
MNDVIHTLDIYDECRLKHNDVDNFTLYIKNGHIPHVHEKTGLVLDIPDLSMEMAFYLSHRRNPALLNPESLIQIMDQ